MKAFGEHFDIQIAIDYEMKIKFILFIVLFNLLKEIVGYLYIIYL